MNDRSDHNKQNRPYRQVLRVSLPLVISMSSTMIMEFTDRIFLANYSLNAIAAALPAGIALALGANLGTCVTAMLAAMGKSRPALRAASNFSATSSSLSP